MSLMLVLVIALALFVSPALADGVTETTFEPDTTCTRTHRHLPVPRGVMQEAEIKSFKTIS